MEEQPPSPNTSSLPDGVAIASTDSNVHPQGMEMPTGDLASDLMKTKKPKGKRKRSSGSGNLTVEQKRRICEKHRSTPKITQKDLCRWAKLEFNLEKGPKQPTMSNILKNEKMYRDPVGGVLDANRKTIRSTQNSFFDQVLANWVMERQAQGTVTGDMIKNKGRELSKQMNLPNKLKFSNGWLASFKARHGLTGKQAQSSASNVPFAPNDSILGGDLSSNLLTEPQCMLPLVSSDLSLEQLQDALRAYEPSDIYTVDETALFFRIAPDKLASSDGQRNAQLADEPKLVAILASNADGSDRLAPYIIGDTLAPASLRDASMWQLGYHYISSGRARMTILIFQQWLRDFNARMASAHRHVVLLMDSAPSHVPSSVALSNVRVVVFNNQIGVKVQPMRAGILSAFKSRYRLKHLMTAIDRKEDGLEDIYYVTQLQAMRWIGESWRQLAKETLAAAWKPLGITTPLPFDPSAVGETSEGEMNKEKEVGNLDKNLEEELWGQLYCLQLTGVVTTKSLVNSRWESDIHKRFNEECLTDPQVKEEEYRVLDTSAAVPQETDVHAPVSGKDLVKSFRDVIRYLEQGAEAGKDPSAASVVEYLKKKRMTVRFDLASANVAI